jgi:SAM-dependent methyltransferase
MDLSSPPHSAAYFGPERDFWWNEDYLLLLAQRFDLERVGSMLDIGAGVGHWGMLLATVLPPDTSITGLERDPRWVAEATRRAAQGADSARFRFDQGVAEALPYEPGTFDLVTCQTVLMHVADPQAVIGEMVRVTKPGGLVLAAEPNNRASFLVDSSFNMQTPINARVEMIRFLLVCERGKVMRGEGNSSVGDLLPGYFVAAGLTDIQTYLNDRAVVMVPPYDEAAQRAYAAGMTEFAEKGLWCWPREEAYECYVAGGGSEGEFDQVWTRLLEQLGNEVSSINAGELHTAGGHIHYIVGGRRA